MWYNFPTFFTTAAILFIALNVKCTHADAANEAQIEGKMLLPPFITHNLRNLLRFAWEFASARLF